MTHVLFVEDSADDAALLSRVIEQDGISLQADRVDRIEDLREALSDDRWDLFIVDYSVPGLSALDALAAIREVSPDTPIIIMSGTIKEEYAVEVMKAGAQDFITKSNTVRLVPAIRRELNELDNRRKRRQAEERVRFLAYNDQVTGLPNRNWLTEHLRATLPEAQNRHIDMALMILHLDGFREVNDTLGYGIADDLLAQAGDRLIRTVGERAVLARMDAADIAVFLEGGLAKGRALSDELARAFDLPFRVGEFSLSLEPRFGVALFPEHGTRDHVLLQHADVALGAAMSATDRLVLYDPDRDPCNPHALALIGDMRTAITGDEYSLHFQPKIDLQAGRIRGVEALLRWQHSEHGMIPPGDFIPLAERSGLINNLTRHVASMVSRYQGSFGNRLEDVPIALNLSPRNLLDPHLISELNEQIRDGTLDPTRLELEITETALMEDPDAIVANITRFTDQGVRIYIDDFGTGYSSLSHLKRLPIDGLKIDKSFVIDMLDNQHSSTIVRSTIDLGHNLGLEVIAEGIENEETLRSLCELGCDTGQGYHLSHPLPVEEISAWLRDPQHSVS